MVRTQIQNNYNYIYKYYCEHIYIYFTVCISIYILGLIIFTKVYDATQVAANCYYVRVNKLLISYGIYKSLLFYEATNCYLVMGYILLYKATNCYFVGVNPNHVYITFLHRACAIDCLLLPKDIYY